MAGDRTSAGAREVINRTLVLFNSRRRIQAASACRTEGPTVAFRLEGGVRIARFSSKSCERTLLTRWLG
jgi:hypothetical protein